MALAIAGSIGGSLSVKFWFDTEFIDPGDGYVHLLSIGIVAEDGREYYAVNKEAPLHLADAWVSEHVIPQLDRSLPFAWGRYTRAAIREQVRGFIEVGGPQPEFWGYIVAYDWVLFCHLMGGIPTFPEGWPKYGRDLRQWADFLGVTDIPVNDTNKHHALWDARWNRQTWQFLEAVARGRLPTGPG